MNQQYINKNKIKILQSVWLSWSEKLHVTRELLSHVSLHDQYLYQQNIRNESSLNDRQFGFNTMQQSFSNDSEIEKLFLHTSSNTFNDHTPRSVLNVLYRRISANCSHWFSLISFWLCSEIYLYSSSSNSFCCVPGKMWQFCLIGSLYPSNSGCLLPYNNLATKLNSLNWSWPDNCVKMKEGININDMPAMHSTLYDWGYYFHFTDEKTQARKCKELS